MLEYVLYKKVHNPAMPLISQGAKNQNYMML